MNPEFIICYIDENKKEHFTFINESLYDYQQNHPNHIIMHAFHPGYDHINLSTKTYQEFIDNCEKYGLDKDDYGRQFIFNETTYQLTGWNNRNKKYKCLLYNITTGRNIKATPDFVKNHLYQTLTIHAKQKETTIT